ncbi:hypothetical protein A2U01_0100242, partial [Trifolium medium]|nr:hypothetical protein [Trifolium medium]
GIEHFSGGKVMEDVITRLNERSEYLAKKMKITKSLYDKLRAPLLKH